MKKLKKADLVLPKFLDDVEEYKRCLDVIAKHNFIDWMPIAHNIINLKELFKF